MPYFLKAEPEMNLKSDETNAFLMGSLLMQDSIKYSDETDILGKR